MHSEGQVYRQLSWGRWLVELGQRLAGAVPVLMLPDIAEGILPSPSIVPAGAGVWGDGRLCNTGGPQSRTRTEPIVSSIFGYDDCRLGARPVGEVHALYIGGDGSAEQALGFRHAAFDALRECGFEDPEAAFDAFADLSRRRLHCLSVPPRNFGWGANRPASGALEFLKTALILGKCSQGLYDPSRPVIWTETRLRRWVQSYEIGNPFYAAEEDD